MFEHKLSSPFNFKNDQLNQILLLLNQKHTYKHTHMYTHTHTHTHTHCGGWWMH